MPAVAQISVNFATLNQIRSNTSALPTNVRVVSPQTLTQYLLNNRELGDTVLSSPAYLNYAGGFISAGDKVNVKHSQFQVRNDIFIERGVYSDFIYSRSKGNTDTTYQTERSGTTRSITLAPFPSDASLATSRNSITLATTAATKNISLLLNFGSAGENSIVLNNDANTKTLNIRTGIFRIDAIDLDIYGAPVYIDETVEINKETTITDNLNASGNLSIGTTSYNKFTVNGTSGNVAFTGNLNINTDRFTVTAASGNTVIAGTLSVGSDVTVGGTTTLSNSLTFNVGSSTSSTRRITGLRQLADVTEYNGTTYDNDAITVGDVKRFGFKSGMIMMWSIPPGQNLSTYFNSNGAGVSTMTGWQICNGQNGSPDLRDKFVIGAGSTYSDKQGGGSASHDHTLSGGSVGNHTLTISQMPSHKHTIDNTDLSGTFMIGGTEGNAICSGDFFDTRERGGTRGIDHQPAATNPKVGFRGNHTHSCELAGGTNNVTQPHGHSLTLPTVNSITVLPPFVALYYIIKT